MYRLLPISLLAFLAAPGCTAGDYSEAEGAWVGEGDALPDEPEKPDGPGLGDSPSPSQLCAAFEDSLGASRIDADVAAILGDGAVHLTLAHAEFPTRACADWCSDAWLLGVELPLTQVGSFDLGINETIGNFTIPVPHDGKCDCLSAHGLAEGSIEVVSISPDVVCGWIVEEQLLEISGGFSVRVLDVG